ncbi:hypothetical protein AVEN_131857-1 [Araneus ventricosus]|uniref:Uncharacterized protein n=1 Tax=Araneus ventricosus TaxID=182803 RepID=A0A4Y2PRP7_ARAVE|nr:hypothetical protein AVEN_131857-1 [Araneus ventricosus]
MKFQKKIVTASVSSSPEVDHHRKSYMVPNKMSPDELKQYFLSLTSLRERKALVESLIERLKDPGKENQPPDYFKVKKFHLLAVENERAMKLQKKILIASDASRPTFSALSTRSLSPIHTSAGESD